MATFVIKIQYVEYDVYNRYVDTEVRVKVKNAKHIYVGNLTEDRPSIYIEKDGNSHISIYMSERPYGELPYDMTFDGVVKGYYLIRYNHRATQAKRLQIERRHESGVEKICDLRLGKRRSSKKLVDGYDSKSGVRYVPRELVDSK